MTVLDHPAIRDYLHRLDAATSALPPDERAEIREGISTHLSEALSPTATDADVRNTVAALGDPYEFVTQPAPQAPGAAPARPATGRGAQEIAAVVLLLIGAFIVPFVGWVAGVVLLWTSKAWTRGQKILGTLVVPGGLATWFAAFFLALPIAGESCMTSAGDGMEAVTVCEGGGLAWWLVAPLAVYIFIGPIVTAVYLLRAAGRAPAR